QLVVAKEPIRTAMVKEVADRVGFEPTNTLRCYLLSKQAPSTARPPVRITMLPMHPRPRWVRASGGAWYQLCQLFGLAGFGASAGGCAGALGLAAALESNGGGISRQGSSLPRIRSGVFSGGTLRALRVLGVSRPGGACSGGISCAPA